MDKLTIEHLAPYLPYGIMCQYRTMLGNKIKVGRIFYINERTVSFEHQMYHQIESCKPLLLPLSYLTKEITHEGNKITPLLELAKIWSGADKVEITKGAVSNYHYVRCEWNNVGGYELLIITDKLEAWYASYFDHDNTQYIGNNTIDTLQGYQYLYSLHFDLHDLLPKNLAIDKSTITT